MVPAGLGWSVGDIIKLVEVSLVVYQAFNDARTNSSRQFQLLTDEFGRFHTCLELLHNVLEEHNKRLYFGHEHFKATLQECQDFLAKYSVLGDRRNSFVRFIKTIGWTTEERGTINRLRTAVHGHAHVIGLYIGYMTLWVDFQ
jgi:adenylate kinase family enzyme